MDLHVTLVELGKPVIAMVNGHALGGGLGLVVASDLAVAAEGAQFATPEVTIGLWPMVITATILRNLPRKQAVELMLTGERISAERAAQIGLINRVAPPERLEEETMALASKLARKSPTAIRMGLHALAEAQDMEYREGLKFLEQKLFVLLQTEDAREGLAAFLQKRDPRWSGR